MTEPVGATIPSWPGAQQTPACVFDAADLIGRVVDDPEDMTRIKGDRVASGMHQVTRWMVGGAIRCTPSGASLRANAMRHTRFCSSMNADVVQASRRSANPVGVCPTPRQQRFTA
jgi:hypothetical protein